MTVLSSATLITPDGWTANWIPEAEAEGVRCDGCGFHLPRTSSGEARVWTNGKQRACRIECARLLAQQLAARHYEECGSCPDCLAACETEANRAESEIWGRVRSGEITEEQGEEEAYHLREVQL